MSLATLLYGNRGKLLTAKCPKKRGAAKNEEKQGAGRPTTCSV